MQFRADLRAVIFDFDGTVLDSYRKSNFYKVAKLRGLKVPAGQKFENYFGKTAAEIIRTFWPSENVEEFHRLWEEIDRTSPPPLVNGAREILDFLKEGLLVKTGILTQRRSTSLIPMLERLVLLAYFEHDLLQTIDLWPHKKPDPKAFENILKTLESRYEVTKQQVLYAGDTLDDWESAKGTGIRFVGVETGPLSRADWRAAGLESENIIPDIGFLPC